MKLKFEKYHGTGNDFIIIDNRNSKYELSTEKIKFLCDRHFGIGADGLMLLESSKNYDFEMKYFNSDGKLGTMCGNGGRCIAAFAKKNNVAGDNINFMASDGSHFAEIISYNDKKYFVKLKLSNVNGYKTIGDDFLLDTGSPHYVIFVEDIENIDVYALGAKIRYDKSISENGVNVNFVEISENEIIVRTYERGVEAETLSCGTGVTASSIAYYLKTRKSDNIKVKTKGGELFVSFCFNNEQFEDIYLQGFAEFVFNGEIDV